MSNNYQLNVIAIASDIDSCVSNGTFDRLLDLVALVQSSAESNQQQFADEGAIVIKSLINLLSQISALAIEPNIFSELNVSILWALCKICRRTISKDTSCADCVVSVGTHAEEIVKASSRLVGDCSVSAVACRLFMILASDSSERQFSLAKHGATGVVVAVMNAHGSDPFAAEMSCRAARNLSIDDDMAAKLVEDGVCDALVSIFRSHLKQVQVPSQSAQSLEVLEACLWTTVNLSCDERVAIRLGEAGCCAAVAETMEVVMLEESAVEAACTSLRNLSSADALNYSRFAEANVCAVLCQCLALYAALPSPPPDPSVQSPPTPRHTIPISLDVVQAGLWAVANLCCDKELSQKLRTSHGAVPTVIAAALAAKTHAQSSAESPDDESAYLAYGPVAEALTWCVRNMATSGLESQTELCASGALEAVADVMEQFADRPGMVENCFDALSNLVIGATGRVPGVRLATTRAIPLSFECVARHMSESDTVEKWLKFIVVVASSDEEDDVVRPKGVDEDVGVDDEVQGGSASVSASAGGAVESGAVEVTSDARGNEISRDSGNSSNGSKDGHSNANLVTLRELGACARVVECVFAHARDPDVFRLACEALLSLHFTSPEQRQALAGKNLLDDTGRHARPPFSSVNNMMEWWGLRDFVTPPEGGWGPDDPLRPLSQFPQPEGGPEGPPGGTSGGGAGGGEEVAFESAGGPSLSEDALAQMIRSMLAAKDAEAEVEADAGEQQDVGTGAGSGGGEGAGAGASAAETVDV